MHALNCAFAIYFEDTGNFDDPVSLDIEPGGFQIDKDKLRHACFRLLGVMVCGSSVTLAGERYAVS